MSASAQPFSAPVPYGRLAPEPKTMFARRPPCHDRERSPRRPSAGQNAFAIRRPSARRLRNAPNCAHTDAERSRPKACPTPYPGLPLRRIATCAGCTQFFRSAPERRTMPVPKAPKLYHIVHIDRVPSIIADGRLWCDSKMAARSDAGTMIGIPGIKERRLRNVLGKYPELCVGDCVPFYFCPRSVMLYVIHKGNHSALTYKDGQERIVHLEAICTTSSNGRMARVGNGCSPIPMLDPAISKTGAA